MDEDDPKATLKENEPRPLPTEDEPKATLKEDQPRPVPTEDEPKATVVNGDPKSATQYDQLELATTEDDLQTAMMQNSDVSSAHAFVHPDGGWGWVICASSMISYGTVGCFIGTFSILYVAMLDEYGKGDDNISAKTAQVGSLFQGLNCLLCPIASIISGRIGIRQTGVLGGIIATAGMISSAFVEDVMLLYFTYSTLVGIGAGFVYGQSYVILTHYFKRRLGLVSGLYYVSTPVFIIALTLVLPSLLSSIGLRYSMIALSCLPLIWIPCSLLWKPLIPQHHEDAEVGDPMLEESGGAKVKYSGSKSAKFLDLSIWKNRNYVLWLVSLGIAMIGYFVPLIHMVRYSEDVFPDHDGSHLVLAVYIGSGLFRFIAGRVTDLNWVSPMIINQVSLLILAVTYIFIPLVQSFTGLLVMCVVVGSCDGCVFCLLGLITIRIVGGTSASQGYGFLWGILSIPLTAGPPLAGLMYDHLGSYDLAFRLSGGFVVVGFLLMFFIRLPKEVDRIRA